MIKKIKFYTFSHKRPDFISIQYESMSKFIQDTNFELVVFNNAISFNDIELKSAIDNECRLLNITSISIEKEDGLVKDLESINGESIFNHNLEYNNSVLACAYPLCWAWKNVISNEKGLVCLIDSDMFFVAPTDFSKTNTSWASFVPQGREGLSTEYMWNGIAIFNMEKMKSPNELNWWCGRIDGVPVDVGGHTIKYIEKYSDEIEIDHIRCSHVSYDESCNFDPVNYDSIGIPGNSTNTIIHYRGGSNWNRMSGDYHIKKTEWIKNKIGNE